MTDYLEILHRAAAIARDDDPRLTAREAEGLAAERVRTAAYFGRPLTLDRVDLELRARRDQRVAEHARDAYDREQREVRAVENAAADRLIAGGDDRPKHWIVAALQRDAAKLDPTAYRRSRRDEIADDAETAVRTARPWLFDDRPAPQPKRAPSAREIAGRCLAAVPPASTRGKCADKVAIDSLENEIAGAYGAAGIPQARTRAGTTRARELATFLLSNEADPARRTAVLAGHFAAVGVAR